MYRRAGSHWLRPALTGIDQPCLCVNHQIGIGVNEPLIANLGSVSGFAPPGDIHRVRNTGDGVAISMHVYGADISRLGISIRREYTLPVLL